MLEENEIIVLFKTSKLELVKAILDKTEKLSFKTQFEENLNKFKLEKKKEKFC